MAPFHWRIVPWFWILVGLAIAMALRSLARGWDVVEEPEGPWSPATVIVPVKGRDEGLRENLAALAGLDYPDFELIVVARSEEDVPQGILPDGARLVIAGEGDPETGEKINNLMAAVAAAREGSEIFAFADSDGRVRTGWLKALAAGLRRVGAGAATGYRWHVPEHGGFWSLLRSVWNAVIAGEFGAGPPRFAWGGAMAIRREVFESARVAEFWKGSISDDYALSAAVRAAGLEIVFAPGAFVASTDGAGGREFLRWIQRQMLITRVYRPKLWAVGLAAHLIYCSAQVASLVVALSGEWVGWPLLAAQWGIGMWKGAKRGAIGKRLLPEYAGWFRRRGWIYPVFDPLSTWIWLYSFLASAVTNQIEWRGNRYRFKASRVRKL